MCLTLSKIAEWKWTGNVMTWLTIINNQHDVELNWKRWLWKKSSTSKDISQAQKLRLDAWNCFSVCQCDAWICLMCACDPHGSIKSAMYIWPAVINPSILRVKNYRSEALDITFKHFNQCFCSCFFIPAMPGTIDLYHFIPLLVTLTLAEGHTVTRK